MDNNKIDKIGNTKKKNNKAHTIFCILLNLSYICIVIGISTYFRNKWVIHGIGLFIYSIAWMIALDEDENKQS